MNKPKCLDLYSGAGGCAKGYQQAGFYVVGVDIKPQPRYVGEKFYQADALEFLSRLIETGEIEEYDLIHASPPCQGYSGLRFSVENYARLIPETRFLLQASQKPYVIENVEGAKKEMKNYLMLCGSMFDLRVRRHRLFECSPSLMFAPFTCNHALKVVKKGRTPDPEKHLAAIYGHFSNQEYARRAMGIDWMNRDELAEAIPPAYTRWIGERMLEMIRVEAL